MATFTNYATLSYSGGTTESNLVTGELLDSLTATKTAVKDSYTGRGDGVSYVVSLVNSGTTALTGLTVTDDLGGYSFNGGTVYPLAYQEGSLRCYVNGVLQAAPVVTAGPPLSVSGLSVPAGGSLILIYQAETTAFAPLGAAASITNEASITGGGLAAALTAQAVITMAARAQLSISKALCPATVTENGQLTYTFVIENAGSAQATAEDQVVLTDTFDPRLNALAAAFNGTVWTEGTQYTYDAAAGVFSTAAGQITVPAADYTQNTDGTWTVIPGTATLVVTGTV